MPRRRIPQATEHRGQIRVRWDGREYYCGPWEVPASWVEFESLKARLMAGGSAEVLSLISLVRRYYDHVEIHYRLPDGTPTDEVRHNRYILDALIGHAGAIAAEEFGISGLKAFRDKMVQRGLGRKTINKNIGRVVRMFKWAADEELVAPEVSHRLAAVAGLKAGRTPAPDWPPVEPVDHATVEATLPFLPLPLQIAVQIQLHTGVRPGEALGIRASDIDRSGPIWILSPTCPVSGKPRHKTAHAQKSRRIAIGPKLQRILKQHFSDQLAANDPGYLLVRTRGKHKGKRYDSTRYAHMVEAAAAKADLAARERLGSSQRVVPHWSPNQLRHLFLTEVERKFGLREAQIAGGHAHASTTEIYLADDVDRLAKIARKIG